MNNINSWNPVLNKFIEIKETYISSFGKSTLYDYNPDEESCLEYWVRMLGIKEYEDLIKPLQFTEHDGKLLIRYANFEKLFGNSEQVNESLSETLEVDFQEKFDFDSFWDKYDGFYMECRSVVIDIYKNCLILTPFRKFRNLNECEENSIGNIRERIKKARCVEISNKLDGSMQSARWCDNQIIMAGSQALDLTNSWRLEDGYHMLNENPKYKRMLKDFPDDTFIFEYISLNDAHVVHYKKEQEGLYLIGRRSTITGAESSYKEIQMIAKEYGILTTEIYNTSFEDIVNNLDKKKSNEAEGFVLNIDGYKVKVKYDDYVRMHRLLSVLSAPNLVIRSIADGNFDDFLSKVPDVYRNRVFNISDKVFAYLNKRESIIQEYLNQAPKTNRKEFMLWTENIPREYRGFVRSKYLGEDYNLIKSKSGRYKKFKEIEEFFTKENETEKEKEDDYERE